MRLYDKRASVFSFAMGFYFEIMFKIHGSEKETTLPCNNIKKLIGSLINFQDSTPQKTEKVIYLFEWYYLFLICFPTEVGGSMTDSLGHVPKITDIDKKKPKEIKIIKLLGHRGNRRQKLTWC